MRINTKNKHCITSIAFAGILLAAPATRAAESETPLGKLDALAGHWIELRTTVAEEKREWVTRENQWKDEINLLEQEAETLKNEIDEGDAFASSVEKNRVAALARKEQTERELQKLRSILDSAESDLRQWHKRIPPGLRTSMTAAFTALPETQEEADNLQLTKRAQTVAALYTQIETIQNQLHALHETLDVNGTRRQVDLLYIGLARAFAVSPANNWAAVGIPTDDGWTWTTATEEVAVIRRAIDILNRQETARLVALPMQVAKEVRP